MRLFKRRKKVLVVGGAGFIGTNLVKELERHSEYRVRVLDLILGQDVLDGIEERYDTIVFLAVKMGNRPSDYRYNERLYDALDDYMEIYPDTQVIYTSSAAVYPDSKQPSSELTLPQPFNNYGKAKLLGEYYVCQYRNHTILRLSNVYGPGGHGVVDLFKEGHKKIYGKGDNVRDYVTVFWVADTIIRAIKNPARWFGITNVSSGFGQTVMDVWRDYNPTDKPEHVAPRKTDVKCSILDNTRLLVRFTHDD